jgi:GAF domain-containing protein
MLERLSVQCALVSTVLPLLNRTTVLILAYPVFAQLTHQQLPPDAATKSMMCMPVFNAQRQVVAVVQAIGKKCPAATTTDTTVSTATIDSSSSSSSSCAFSAADESALRALCSHISVDLENLKLAEFVDTDLEQTITLLKAHGKLSTLELPSG